MPNHMVIRSLAGIEEGTDGIGEPSSQHEAPENWSSLGDDGWNNENNQPAHEQIKEKAEFLVNFLGENFIENAKDSRPPLEDNN